MPIREFRGRPPRRLELEHLLHEERLKELGYFSLQQGWVWGHLGAVCQILWGSCQEDKAGLFPRVHCSRRDSWQGKVHVHVRKKSFSTRTVQYWNRLTREAVQSLSWEVFKTQPDKPWASWCDLISEPGFSRSVRPDGLLRSLPTGKLFYGELFFRGQYIHRKKCHTKSHLLANVDFFCLDIAAALHCLQLSVFIYEMLSPTA